MSKNLLRDKLCDLCLNNYREEFLAHYTGTREDFRDWLNGVTGLNVCQITDQERAFNAWIQALEAINVANKPISAA